MTLNPLLAPSGNFDLTNWKITLPIDSSGGILGSALEVTNLADYQKVGYFYTATDGAMTFRVSADGATTSGSSYARSELRETNGKSLAGWNLGTGGFMLATLEVDAVPTKTDGSAGKVVVGQIHGKNDELVRLYWDNGKLYFANDLAGPQDKELKFYFTNASGAQPSVSLNERFSYTIDAKGSTLEVSVFADGDVYKSVTPINAVWQSDTLYFKAGAYLGVNETQGSGWGQTSFYDLRFNHTDTTLVPSSSIGIPPPVITPPVVTSPVVPPPVVVTPPVTNSKAGTAGADTLTGGSAADTIEGLAGDDKLYGNDGADYLKGGLGADLLDGGRGADKLEGGEGDDVYYVDDAGDTIVEAYSSGRGGIDTVFSTVGYTLQSDVENLTLLGTADLNATGNGKANMLIGNAGANVIDGGAGSDTMDGGAGNDTYYVNVTTDIVIERANAGIDTIFSLKSRTLDANVENLTLLGDDNINATGNELANVLVGNDDDNNLQGKAGDDVLHGNGGNDKLNGGDGADRLIGGLGADRLEGGAGADVFVFDTVLDSASGDMDRIVDFSRAQGDKITLTSIDANALIAGNQAFDFIGTAAFGKSAGQLRYYQADGHTFVTGDVNGDGLGDFVVDVNKQTSFLASDFYL